MVEMLLTLEMPSSLYRQQSSTREKRGGRTKIMPPIPSGSFRVSTYLGHLQRRETTGMLRYLTSPSRRSIFCPSGFAYGYFPCSLDFQRRLTQVSELRSPMSLVQTPCSHHSQGAFFESLFWVVDPALMWISVCLPLSFKNRKELRLRECVPRRVKVFLTLHTTTELTWKV